MEEVFHTLIFLITYVGLQHQPVSDFISVAEEQSSLISSERMGLLLKSLGRPCHYQMSNHVPLCITFLTVQVSKKKRDKADKLEVLEAHGSHVFAWVHTVIDRVRETASNLTWLPDPAVPSHERLRWPRPTGLMSLEWFESVGRAIIFLSLSRH